MISVLDTLATRVVLRSCLTKATGLHSAPSVLLVRMCNGIMWVKVSSRNLTLVVCGFVSTRVMRAKRTILYLSSNVMPKYSWSKHWCV